MRWLGFLLSALIVGSFALPWVDSPQYGTWSLLDGVRAIADANPNIDTLGDLADVPSPAPDIDPGNTLLWAAAAFGLSFPLAALFALIGLLGYFSKPMAFILGAIPVGLAAYAGYGVYRARENGFLDTLPPDILDQLTTQAQTHLGLGLPAYFGAGAVLFLAGIFGPSRR
jgi:hypothetical protein